ncbi:uncharacterized protein LOC129636267 isoform X3 [Bubalus kerabau]|uniref:uncharacterized protein LOC129636267 isoform X3 n=1 Tax=Bubalus carabanensis TaxID=3119969 RepID=UPI00244E6F85|nr:uncharacterized protein LOC129636267 isoform X3 [Bubalus carabanensis]
MVFPFSSCGERGLLFLVVLRLLTVVASLVAHGLQGAGVMGSRAQASWAPERRRHGLQSAGVMGSRAQASWAPERRRHGLQSAGVMGSRAQASWAPERRRHGLQSAGVMGSRAQASWAAAHVLSSCGAQASAAPRHVQSSRTWDPIHVPCIGGQVLLHCTTRKVPGRLLTPIYTQHLGI